MDSLDAPATRVDLVPTRTGGRAGAVIVVRGDWFISSQIAETGIPRAGHFVYNIAADLIWDRRLLLEGSAIESRALF
jgi:hypothetical protein